MHLHPLVRVFKRLPVLRRNTVPAAGHPAARRPHGDSQCDRLLKMSENLVKCSVWIIRGDGWGYDNGFGGLGHVLASGRDVNILLLDTAVYSNTGGQTSKATPKKDQARLAMDCERGYVAQAAFGAKDIQTLHAFLEAESYSGTSLIIAYSPTVKSFYARRGR
jgi:pyruvate-ferredoxin/flavodoxin oxidoreductase